MTLTIGSLFSGAGGLDLAVEEVFGAKLVWQSEIDPAASKVLAHRFPGVPNLGSVTEINWDTAPRVEIMCGGYPCQPFSAAGQRKGTDDERHLWPYFADAIRRVRPRYVVLENVAGHRSMGFDSVLGDLASLRYDAQWCSVRASDVGAPHRRERLFVLAVDADTDRGRLEGGTQRDGESLEPELEASHRGDADRHSSADSSSVRRDEGWPARQLGGSDAAVRSDGPVDLLPTPKSTDFKRNDSASERERRSPALGAINALLPTPNAQDGNGGGRYNSEGHQSTLPGTVRELLPTPRKSDGDGGANPLHRAERMDDVETRVIRCGTSWGKYEPAIRRWEALTRPAPSPTEPNTNGNPRLAAAFPEWMQGWPDGWVTAPEIGISRNDQLRCIGNGVCPQQAVYALRWLVSVAGLGVAA